MIYKSDMDGNLFEFPTFYLPDKEYSKIIHEINDFYDSKYKNKRFAMHRSIDIFGKYCIYYFENHGYGDYNIVGKVVD